MNFRTYLIVVFLVMLEYSSFSQEVMNTIFEKWDKAVILSLRNKIGTNPKESVISSLNDEIEFWEDTHRDGEQYDYEFKYFADKYSCYFLDNAIIIKYKNLHEKKIYAIKDSQVTAFFFENGTWSILSKKDITKECYDKVTTIIKDTDLCMDDNQSGWDKIVITEIINNKLNVHFLFELCKYHLDLLEELGRQ